MTTRTSLGQRVAAVLAGTMIVVGISASAVSAQVATLATPGPDADASAAPAQELNGQDGLLAYASCMRDNGIEMDDPRFDANGAVIGGLGKDSVALDRKSETYQAALEACGEFVTALKPASDPEQQAEQTDALLRYAACMREQGLDWPDPAVDGDKFAASEVDKKAAAFLAANEACKIELAPGSDEAVPSK